MPWLLPCLAWALLAATAMSADPEAPPQQVSFQSLQTLPARAPDSRHRYGEAASQYALYWRARNRPAGDPAPLLTLIHGGCWLADYGVDYLFPLATALADAGYAVWAPEYRRVGEAGGGWPGTFTDISAAIESLHRLAPAGVDLTRELRLGHSAGGHLALWSAARPHNAVAGAPAGPQVPPPVNVIGLAAITDLAAYAGGDNSCQQVTPRLLGGTLAEQPGRYASVSPAQMQLLSPVLLLRGGQDSIVGTEQTLGPAAVRDLEGAGHFDWAHPGTPAVAALLHALAGLLPPRQPPANAH